jgi:Putative transposase
LRGARRPSLDGTRWIACRPRFLPAGARALAPVSSPFLQNLQDAFETGKLRFFGNLAGLAEPTAFAAGLHQLRQIEWVVYAKPPFGGSEQVMAYLGRYTHRVAIPNSRPISLSDGKVRFSWKDHRQDSKTKLMTLDADEFIRRFLLHALPDRFHRIRLLRLPRQSPTRRQPRSLPPVALCHPAMANSELADGYIKGDRQNYTSDFLICPDCSGNMRRIAAVPRSSTYQPFYCDTS